MPEFHEAIVECPVSPEVWVDVPDCEGYQVSISGQMRSRWQRGGPDKWFLGDRWVLLKPDTVATSHHKYTIRSNGKRKQVLVHQLVLKLFGPPKPFEGALSLHKDDNKDNNHVSNLYWGTAKDNAADRKRNGYEPCQLGDKAHHRKLSTEDVVRVLKMLAEGVPGKTIAEVFHVTPANISAIKTGKSWSHINASS